MPNPSRFERMVVLGGTMKVTDKQKEEAWQRAKMNDAYTDGYCGRCNRPRVECQKIIDAGKRCTEKAEFKKEENKKS